MTRTIILAASTVVLAAISGQAFAYSNVVAKPSREAISGQRVVQMFNSPDQTMPAPTDTADTYRYHGGPKSND
jgi:hypothetical protein